MTPRPLQSSHRHLRVVVAICAAAVLAAACSDRDSAEGVSADAPMLIEASQNYVTFQNRLGLPLTDVSIAIVPYGPGEFTRLLPRIENTVKRQIPINEFRGRDGTPLNLRVVRPKSIRVRAQDAAGKSHELEVPWK